MNTQYEDKTRYTAPADNEPEELRYSTRGILAYIESWIPGCTADSYTIEEVKSIILNAGENITDEEYGINTI